MKKYVLAGLILTAFIASSVHSKVIVEDAKTMHPSGYRTEISYKYVKYDATYWDTAGQLQTKPYGYSSRKQTILFDSNYGIIDNLEIGLEIPYVIRNEKGSADDTAADQKNHGIGDILIKQKVRFLKEDVYLPDISAGLKMKFPSGEATPKDTESVSLGTGTLDFSAGAYVSKNIGPVNVALNAGYEIDGDDSSGLNYGDKIIGGLKIGYKPWEWITLGCEVSGYYKYEDQDKKKKIIDETRGYLIVATPIIAVSPIKELSIELSADYAFYGRNGVPFIAPRLNLIYGF